MFNFSLICHTPFRYCMWYRNTSLLILRITRFLECVHRPVIENTTFRKLDLFPSSGVMRNAYSVGSLRKLISVTIVRWLMLALSKGPNRVGISPHNWGRKQVQFPKRSVFYNWTMDTVQEPSNSECHTPSSEPFRMYKFTNKLTS
jgi:hypothetical protein